MKLRPYSPTNAAGGYGRVGSFVAVSMLGTGVDVVVSGPLSPAPRLAAGSPTQTSPRRRRMRSPNAARPVRTVSTSDTSVDGAVVAADSFPASRCWRSRSYRSTISRRSAACVSMYSRRASFSAFNSATRSCSRETARSCSRRGTIAEGRGPGVDDAGACTPACGDRPALADAVGRSRSDSEGNVRVPVDVRLTVPVGRLGGTTSHTRSTVKSVRQTGVTHVPCDENEAAGRSGSEWRGVDVDRSVDDVRAHSSASASRDRDRRRPVRRAGADGATPWTRPWAGRGGRGRRRCRSRRVRVRCPPRTPRRGPSAGGRS